MSDMPQDIYKPEIKPSQNEAILILTADNTEDLEFFYPYYRFIEAGYRVDVATPKGGEFKGKQGLGLKTTNKITDTKVQDYAMLYIPGGKAPEALKKDVEAVRLVKDFTDAKKPIAAICHGPQLLAEANVIQGKKVAAWPEVQQEVEKAGAKYVNEATVTDGEFITARWPADLPSHMVKVLEAIRQTTTKAKAA